MKVEKEFKRFEQFSKLLYDKAERNEKLIKEVGNLKKNIDSLNETIKTLKDKNKANLLNIQLTNENNDLKLKNEQLANEIKELYNENLELKEEILELTKNNENSKLKEDNEILSNHHKDYESKDFRFNIYFSAFKDKINGLISEIEFRNGGLVRYSNEEKFKNNFNFEDIEVKDLNIQSEEESKDRNSINLNEVELMSSLNTPKKFNDTEFEIKCFKSLQYLKLICELAEGKETTAITLKELQDIHKQIVQKEMRKNDLSFYCNKQNYRELMEVLSAHSIPDQNWIGINCINNSILPSLNLFLINSIPSSLSTLVIHCDSGISYQNLLPSLFIAIPKVKYWLYLQHLVLSREDLEKLLSVCNSEILKFAWCTFDLSSVPDLSSISKSSIKQLQLYYIESNDGFYGLLAEGISKSEGIRECLEQIQVQDNKVKEEEVESMKEDIIRYGMEKIEVKTYFNKE